MSIIRLSSSMALTHKPANNNHFIFDKKTSKPCLVSCINGTAATGLTTSCSSFRIKALQTCDDQVIPTQRRRGNYKPPVWDHHFIQSLSSEYNKDERYLKRASNLTVQVNKMLDEEAMEFVQHLELIDDLERLGISYHFADKIKHILNRISDQGCKNYQKDLHSTALRFRLLRQHGFSVSEEVFDCFKNEDGDFKASLGDDAKGLLQLYEASFMLTRGEKTLELARAFAAKFLQEKTRDNGHDEYVSLLVHNALELPLHWRIPRLHARWFINAYARRANMSPFVLELAKLDFNIVQATHQQELKHLSSWWKQTRLAEKLPFARDMLVHFYFFAFYVNVEPQYEHSRIMATKVNALVTVIDDLFDVYGTVQELQLFNNAIQRWDIEAMDKLPDYMQICFLALNNVVDEMAYDVLKEQGFLIIPHLRKSWADLFQTYLQEAEWYSEGYTPKLEEYISNACSSSSALVLLSHTFFLVSNPIDKEAVESLHNSRIVQYAGLILRLANDLGTSTGEMERGDVPKSLHCYMNETGAGVKEAREHVKFLMYETWKKMNEELVQVADSPFRAEFVKTVVGLARMAHYAYQYENKPGIEEYVDVKDGISSFLFEPIYA